MKKRKNVTFLFPFTPISQFKSPTILDPSKILLKDQRAFFFLFPHFFFFSFSFSFSFSFFFFFFFLGLRTIFVATPPFFHLHVRLSSPALIDGLGCGSPFHHSGYLEKPAHLKILPPLLPVVAFEVSGSYGDPSPHCPTHLIEARRTLENSRELRRWCEILFPLSKIFVSFGPPFFKPLQILPVSLANVKTLFTHFLNQLRPLPPPPRLLLLQSKANQQQG